MICSIPRLIPTDIVFCASIVEVRTQVGDLITYSYKGNFRAEVNGTIPETYLHVILDGIPLSKVVSSVRDVCYFEFKRGNLHRITFFNLPLDAFGNRIPVVTMGGLKI